MPGEIPLPEAEEAKGGSGGVPSLAEAMTEGGGRPAAPAPVRLTLQAMAQRLAQRYNLDPGVVSQLVDELLEEASKDPELEEVLGVAKYLDVIKQLGRGTVSERLQDLVSSRVLAKLGDRLVKRLDGEEYGLDPRITKILETITMYATLGRFAAQLIGDDRPRGEDIAEAVARAMAQQQAQIAAALEKLGETFSRTVEAMNKRIEALETALQEMIDRKREEATRRLIEEVTSRIAGSVSKQVEALSKTLESLSKALESVNERVSKLERGAPAQGGFTSIADVIDQFVQQAEKLRKLGIEIVTPDKKIEELERRLKERLEKGEVSGERYEELLRELERLRKEKEDEERRMKMKMLEIEMRRKEEEIKAMRSFLESVGKAIYELVREPSKLRELIGLVQGISGIARPGQAAELQPSAVSPPPANIPRLADVLEEESLGSGGGMEEAPTGEEGGVREEGAGSGSGGAGEGGDVQRPPVREEGAGAAGSEEGGGEAGDEGGGEAGVQGRGGDG